MQGPLNGGPDSAACYSGFVRYVVGSLKYNQLTEVLMSKVTINLKGKSGSIYPFTVYEMGSDLTPKDVDFKEAAGLYSFFKKNPDGGTYRVTYIGQTEDLSSRPSPAHHKADAIKKHGTTHVGRHWVDTKKARDFAESDLIENYKPPCNDHLK